MQCKVEGCLKDVFCKGYCCKHNHQMERHGKILLRTTMDANEIITKTEYAEVVLFNKNNIEVGRVIVDTEDLEKVRKYKWYLTDQGYVSHKSKIKLSMHRYVIGCPLDKEVDHINGNPLDNRKSNLRTCTHKENVANKRMRNDNTSGVIGVRFHKLWGWQAYIAENGKQKHIGWYKTKEEAMEQRLIKSKEQYGEFAPERRMSDE